MVMSILLQEQIELRTIHIQLIVLIEYSWIIIVGLYLSFLVH